MIAGVTGLPLSSTSSSVPAAPFTAMVCTCVGSVCFSRCCRQCVTAGHHCVGYWRHRLPASFAVLALDIGEHAAAYVELGAQTHVTRLGCGDEIAQNTVGHVFVELAFVAIRPDVELERLKLDAEFVRHVFEIE